MRFVHTDFTQWLSGVRYVYSLHLRRHPFVLDAHSTGPFITITGGAGGIDWSRVTQQRGTVGVEVNPYLQEFRRANTWYYDWDVASGVIWDTDSIVEAKLLATRRADGMYVLDTTLPAQWQGLTHVPQAARDEETVLDYQLLPPPPQPPPPPPLSPPLMQPPRHVHWQLDATVTHVFETPALRASERADLFQTKAERAAAQKEAKRERGQLFGRPQTTTAAMAANAAHERGRLQAAAVLELW